MNEIKELGTLKLEYKEAEYTMYLFLNTDDYSVYSSNQPLGAENFSAPNATDIVLNENVESFEEVAELIEEIKIPYKKYHEKDLQNELIFYSSSLDRYIKTRFEQRFYEFGNPEQSFYFNVAMNLSGGLN
ncbi:hypothetical protein KJJ36_01145 [Staphylococcus pseudoxylosus]|uniref:hypothetical protein n=1 Tax=Staphylococcus pseudoxylosus TaxID=2282419 RepID=UPI001F16EA4E|nr:hypothetical protein [Staphylococcus pseudoxylosus]MCE5000995.1 hypothetical protein [Staphylococcus pseudoxylosus]